MKNSKDSDYCGPLDNPRFAQPKAASSIQGQNLKDFLGAHLHKSEQLRSLAKQWAMLIQQRSQSAFDGRTLQHSNIWVQQQPQNGSGMAGALKLSFRDDDLAEDTVTPYQHPHRCELNLSEQETDRFAALVIYLSILALAENPKLWPNYCVAASEGLLFVEADFLNPAQSSVFRNLAKMPEPVRTLTQQLQEMCSRETNAIPSLEAVRLVAQQAIPAQSPTPVSSKPVSSNPASTESASIEPAASLESAVTEPVSTGDIPATALPQQLEPGANESWQPQWFSLERFRSHLSRSSKAFSNASVGINWSALALEVLELLFRTTLASLYWLATTVIFCLAIPFRTAPSSKMPAEQSIEQPTEQPTDGQTVALAGEASAQEDLPKPNSDPWI